MPGAQHFHLPYRGIDLLASRHESRAVLQRPAVILHMRNLYTACAKRQCQGDHGFDAFDIGAMHDHIDRQWQAEANNLQADGAASLIAALSTTDDACIQLGTLLLIKATRAGKHIVIARTLTFEELRQLERNQTLLREPEKLLQLLENADRRQDNVVDASTHN